MLKRIVILVFVLSTLVLWAMNPMNNVTPASENTSKLQATVDATLPVVVTSSPDATPGTVPVTGGEVPMSVWIIFG